jgi:hypothetical protein
MSDFGVVTTSSAELLEKADHAGPSQLLTQCRQTFATNLIKRLVGQHQAGSDTIQQGKREPPANCTCALFIFHCGQTAT